MTKLICSTTIEGEVVHTDALVGVYGVGVLDSEVALFFRMAWVRLSAYWFLLKAKAPRPPVRLALIWSLMMMRL